MIARLPLPWSRSQSRRRSSSERDKIRYAKALNDRSRCTLLYFNSDKCKLCAYLSKKHLHELFEEDNEGELNLVQLSIENESWYPEVLYYRIEYVPCFILLDKKNRARLKSTIPTDPARVLKSLHEIIEEGKKM